MGAVVCKVVLQAGAWRGRITAAKRNTIQQETPVHVTPDTTGRDRGGRDSRKKVDGNRLIRSRNGRRVRGEKEEKVNALSFTAILLEVKV